MSGEGLDYFCDTQILLLSAKGNALDLIDVYLSMYKLHENDCSTGGQADYLALSFPPPVFDCFQYANTENKGLGDLVM